MHRLTMTHTMRWHHAHGTLGPGPLYQARFTSFPVDTVEHLLTVCRDVERNALRANLVEEPRTGDGPDSGIAGIRVIAAGSPPGPLPGFPPSAAIRVVR